MICSILIPSRKRVERLKACIASFFSTASGSDWDIRIRLDDDDRESLKALPELQEHCFNRIAVSVGERLGWDRIEEYYLELSGSTTARWIWFFNDDAVVEGSAWDNKLAAVPAKGFIVQPEIHRLGGSSYPRDPRAPFVIVPNRVWEEFGLTQIPHPNDVALPALLREHGWQTAFLPGIGIHHQRDNDEQLKQHRADFEPGVTGMY